MTKVGESLIRAAKEAAAIARGETRCPQDIFDRFKVDPAGARAAAISWLLRQPRHAGETYIIPNPATGEDMIVDAQEDT